MRPTLPGALIGVALVGVGVGGTNPLLLAYLGDISPADDVDELGGVYNVFDDMGSPLGPIVALPVASRIGYTTEYLLCAGVVVLTGALVLGTLLAAPPDPNPRLAD